MASHLHCPPTMDTLPVLDHGILSRLRLVTHEESERLRPTPLQSKVLRFSQSAMEALRTMRTALLLGNYSEASTTAASLALFAREMGTLRVEQLCDLLQDIGPDERAYFAARLLSTLEVEIRCAIAALNSNSD